MLEHIHSHFNLNPRYLFFVLSLLVFLSFYLIFFNILFLLTERSNYSTLKTVAITVPIVVSILLFMLGLYLLWRRVTTQRISTEQNDGKDDKIST